MDTRAEDMAAAVVDSVPGAILTAGLNDNEILQAKVALSCTKEQIECESLLCLPLSCGPSPSHYPEVRSKPKPNSIGPVFSRTGRALPRPEWTLYRRYWVRRPELLF